MTEKPNHDVTAIRAQVAAQHRVLAHMGRVIADCHEALNIGVEAGHFDATLDFMGQRSAWLMETLGDFLNGMDAVSEDDAWVDPIFKEARAPALSLAIRLLSSSAGSAEMEMEAPPLVCKNCGKEPHQHIVRKERLTCPGLGGRVEWEYTDDRRAWDILCELENLDARRERLSYELAKVTGQPWAQL